MGETIGPDANLSERIAYDPPDYLNEEQAVVENDLMNALDGLMNKFGIALEDLPEGYGLIDVASAFLQAHPASKVDA